MQLKNSSFLAPAIALLLSVPIGVAATATQLPLGTAPIPLASLPTLFPAQNNDAGSTAAAIEEVRNTLALYPFSIDGKNFAALENIFAENAVANYSAPLNVLTPLSTIEATLEASLACVTTQHLLGTQLIDILAPSVAASVTYYRAAHFGTGSSEGQVVYAYGQYQDTWNKQADGTWKIVYRNLVYMGPLIGNETIFAC